MPRTLLVLVLSLLSIVNSLSATAAIVIELTDATFEEDLLYYEHAMVLFYSPACKHCQEAMPEFERAADELIRNEPPVHAARIDCFSADGRETCRQQAIDALPAIKVYRSATLIDEYEGARVAGELVPYMRNLVGITSHVLSTADGAIAFAVEPSKECTVVAFLAKKGSLREHYFGLPPQLSKDIRFGHLTVDPEDAGVVNVVKLMHPEYMHSKFESPEYYYTGDGEDLLEFIIKHRYGMVGLRKPKNVDDFAPPLVIAYYRVDVVKNQKMFAYWRNRILKVAANFTEYLNFAISPLDEFQQEIGKFGLEMPLDEAPLVFAIMEDNTKYLMHEEFSVENFRNFLQSLLEKNAEPHLISQPIPEDDGGLVKTAVARNFKQLVAGSNRDVLLVFFAPWCSHCRRLDGILEQLAQILQQETVVIVKMDGTANEIPAGYDVEGYPTLYWVPQDGGIPMAYNQASRSLNELLAFIAKHASVELSGFDRRGRAKSEKDEL